MKFLKYIFTSIFFIASLSAFAQSPKLLKAEGKIPKEFITPSTVKYKKQVETLKGEKAKKRETKNKKQFILESNFTIDDVLQSGLVLFNDPATVYINKVLANLTYQDRVLKKKKPRAYILNSAAVNAFATDQGIIFVTLGLLANLQNEAQLAFILSHELIHIKHEHSINKFVKDKEVDRRGGKKQSNVESVMVDRNAFKKSMYSRSLEEQADEEGMDIFLNSAYDPKAITNTFKILHYSYLPFEDFPFKKSFFEDQHYEFPQELWVENVKKISPMTEDKKREKKSSHPSSLKRLKKVEQRIAANMDEDKKAFVLPEKEFLTIQNKARYQIPFLNLYAENFPEAIYTAYLMLDQFPDDIELKKVIGKALLMEAKYKHSGAKNSLDLSRSYVIDNIEGSVQRLYFLLAQISAKEMTILAYKYNWNLSQAHPKDKELQWLVKNLAFEFAYEFEDLDDFKRKSKQIIPKQDTTKQVVELSKQEKIDRVAADVDYWQYAFVEELKDSKFEQQFEDGLEEAEKRKKKEKFYESREGITKLREINKREDKKGKQLGIGKIVVVNPFYLSLNESKTGTIEFLRSEEKQIAFREALNDIAKVSKIKTQVLDVTDISIKDIEKFNDIHEVNQYFSEQMSHNDLNLSPGYNQKEINAIADKYGTDYFLWTGVISLKEDRKSAWTAVGLSLFIPYFLPFTLANALTPEYDMLYYAILFDIRTGKRSYIKMDFFDKRDSKSILNAHIYDVFHQIKSKGK